jgi:hypothetical protein
MAVRHLEMSLRPVEVRFNGKLAPQAGGVCIAASFNHCATRPQAPGPALR